MSKNKLDFKNIFLQSKELNKHKIKSQLLTPKLSKHNLIPLPLNKQSFQSKTVHCNNLEDCYKITKTEETQITQRLSKRNYKTEISQESKKECIVDKTKVKNQYLDDRLEKLEQQNDQLHSVIRKDIIENRKNQAVVSVDDNNQRHLEKMIEYRSQQQLGIYHKKFDLKKIKEFINQYKMQNTFQDPFKYKNFYYDIYKPFNKKNMNKRQLFEYDGDYGMRVQNQRIQQDKIQEELKKSFGYQLFKKYLNEFILKQILENVRKIKSQECLSF